MFSDDVPIMYYVYSQEFINNRPDLLPRELLNYHHFDMEQSEPKQQVQDH
jgi:hypothetical protein